MVLRDDLTIDVERGDGRIAIKLSGEIDFGNVGRLRSALVDANLEDEPEVVIDMNEVLFIDSTTLGVIVQGKKRLEEHGRRLLVSGVSPRVMRIFELAGLTDYFGLPETA